MGNFYGTARSSYFKVRNKTKFWSWCQEWGCTVREGTGKKEGLTAFISDCEHGLPHCREGDETGEDGPDHFIDQLVQHIDDGWAAIVMETGGEGDRYLDGFSFAVRSDGKILKRSIYDIYDSLGVKKWKTTECSY